jgi:arylsulfatase A-like enzyme
MASPAQGSPEYVSAPGQPASPADGGGTVTYPLATTVRLAFVLALLVGLFGGSLMVIKAAVLSRLVWYDPNVLWLSPVSHALWAVPCALLLGAVHKRFPRLVSVRVVVFLMVAVLLYGVLRVYWVELEKWAAALITLGIATQASQWRTFHDPARLAPLLKRGTLVAVGLVAVTAAGLIAAPSLGERWAQRGRPSAAPGSPNVVLIILDTVRAISMGLYGNGRPTTPAIDAFATTGVTFDLAIAPSPWTLPSHASLFTGRAAHEVNATWRTPLDDSEPTLAEVLSSRGYRTAGLVANLFNANSAMGLARGFDRYTDFTVDWTALIRATYPGGILLNEVRRRWYERDFEFEDFDGRRTAAEMTDDLLSWIRSDRERPFFAFVNYFDAHDPYVAPDTLLTLMERLPQRFAPVYDLERDRLVPAPPERVEQARGAVGRYEAALRYLDSHIGHLLQELEADGVLDNTVVIITSDHGEEFGEHGLRWHGHSLYLPALHVPLVISWPRGVPAGVRVGREVTLQDVAATVLDLTSRRGVSRVAPQSGSSEPGTGQLVPGHSLARFWEANAAAGRVTPVISTLQLDRNGVERWSGSRRLASVVLDGQHYIRYERGIEELYDLGTDPGETRDLARAAGSSTNAYRALIPHAWLKTGHPERPGEAAGDGSAGGGAKRPGGR